MNDEECVQEDDASHGRWVEGCRREAAICALLKRHEDEHRLSSTDVADVAWELGGTSRATLTG